MSCKPVHLRPLSAFHPIAIVALTILLAPNAEARPPQNPDGLPEVRSPDFDRIAAKSRTVKPRSQKRAPTAPKVDRQRLELKPPAVDRMVINKGRGRATSPRFNIFWSHHGGRPTHYQLSTSPSFSGEGWAPYRQRNQARFDLPPGMRDSDGTVTLYFRMMNDAGPSNVVSDSIQYFAPPRITKFELNNGSGQTSRPLLSYRVVVDGKVTGYRVSEFQNFNGVPWTSASQYWDGRGLYRIRNDANGTKTLYVQVRRETGQADSSSDSINYQPQYTEYVLKNREGVGDASLKRAILTARDHGWEFQRRKIGDGGVGCFVGGIRINETSSFTGTKPNSWKWYTGVLWAQGLYYSLHPTIPSLDPTQPDSSRTNCEFTLFDGRELNSGWRIKSVKLRTELRPYEANGLANAFKLPVNALAGGPPGGVCKLKEGPAAHGKEPVFTVRVEYPAVPVPGVLPYMPCIIDEITLMGPPPPPSYDIPWHSPD